MKLFTKVLFTVALATSCSTMFAAQPLAAPAVAPVAQAVVPAANQGKFANVSAKLKALILSYVNTKDRTTFLAGLRDITASGFSFEFFAHAVVNCLPLFKQYGQFGTAMLFEIVALLGSVVTLAWFAKTTGRVTNSLSGYGFGKKCRIALALAALGAVYTTLYQIRQSQQH